MKTAQLEALLALMVETGKELAKQDDINNAALGGLLHDMFGYPIRRPYPCNYCTHIRGQIWDEVDGLTG